jgi:ketosteroid isomerase-like protein
MEAGMAWSRTGWTVAALAVLHAGTASAQGPGVTERQIQSMLDQSAESWNRGDLDGHLADNADSISFMTRNGPIIGKTRTADALRRSFFKAGKPVQQLRFEQVTIRRLGNGHALVVGRFVLEGGGQEEHTGWFSTIWERQAVGWRVIHDHSS